MSGLLNKVALVTGAARGTGRVHCERFADAGADIIALDVASAAADLAEIADAVKQRGQRCYAGVADVSSFDEMQAAVDEGVWEFGRLDVVVANAGIHSASAPAWEVNAEDWQRVIAVNLTGVWHTVKASVPHFGPGGGSVVIISSTNGLRGTANTSAYTATKHAVVGLARTLANEMGPKRIRVNTVHPGAVGTAMVRNPETFKRIRPDLENPTEDDVAAVLSARNLLPVPWVEPEDVSNAVVFLASDEARYITGTQLVVDAGLTQKA